MKRSICSFSGSVSQTSFENYLLLILIPIAIFYFLTMRPGHDWGGDFAQYISHAKNIAHGKPYSDTGYIYCPYDVAIGPREYPPGFPLLLAPVYRIFGLSFIAFKVEIVIFLLGSIGVISLFSREYVPTASRMALILLFSMNPWVVSFKDNVLSDVPFLFFVYSFLLWAAFVYRAGNFTPKAAAICGALISIAYLIRAPGLLLIPALFVYDVYHNRRISSFALMTISFSLTVVVLSKLLFHSEGSYLDQFANWRPVIVLYNARYYLSALGDLWPKTFGVPGSHLILYLLASLLAVLGFCTHRRISIGEIFATFYIALILIWPSRQGLRFLLPIVPLYFLYLLIGVKSAVKLAKQRYVRYVIVGTLVLLSAASYLSGLAVVLKDSRTVPDGPFTPAAVEMLRYIREKTSPDATVVFRKPRVLALFTGRSATAYPPSLDYRLISEYFRGAGVDYVVVDLENEADGHYLFSHIQNRPSDFRVVFLNSRFVAYVYGRKGGESGDGSLKAGQDIIFRNRK